MEASEHLARLADSDHLDVLRAVVANHEAMLDALRELTRIPSVSADPKHAPDVRRSAEASADLLRRAGLTDVELLELDGAHPYVLGSWTGAGSDAPTVLLYAHHDVQPAQTAGRWGSPPFEPSERNGRLYGRGAADDKAGVVMHAAAIKAWLDTRGALPVNVHVLVEGEEELGSPNLDRFMAAHADKLRSDVLVIADLPNWDVDTPALTTTLRGVGMLTVEVRALEQPVHSGMWGGPVPDALTGLVRLLATLHRDDGTVAVEGFSDIPAPSDREHAMLDRLAAAHTAEDILAEVQRVEGLEVTGGENVLHSMWRTSTLTVIGVDAPSVSDASNQLLASAGARLSMRFAPGQDPAAAVDALERHLREHAPWGMQVTVIRDVAVAGWSGDVDSPAVSAAERALTAGYGKDAVHIGCGGSIPFVEVMQDACDGAPALLLGVEDPATNAHGEDESLHLEMFLKACLSETLLLAELTRR